MNRINTSIILLLFNWSLYGNQITIIGCGYVGLTMAGLLSQGGNNVTCVDIDTTKIAALNNQQLPIYEPHLKEFLWKAVRHGNLVFTDSLNNGSNAEIFYICVATPANAYGNCDCSLLFSVFNDIVSRYANANYPIIICIKSTVPPGTIRKLHEYLVQEKKHTIHVIYNPEFMREGSAIQDIHINPIVLAGESLEAMQKIEHMYSNLLVHKGNVIKTNFETAEIIKYAWNSFSAIRITYVNELAFLCRAFNADIDTVVQGLAFSEKLLPTEEIKPGPGYGGSCLPKDILSFSKVMEEKRLSFSLVHQAIVSNQNHKERLLHDLFTLLGTSKTQKVVTLLGLSFKAHTDDIRNAPAIDIIKVLIEHGIIVKVYDPQAIHTMKLLFPDIHYFDSPYEAIKETDCIVVLTEWEEIKELDFDKIALLCHQKMIIDAKNIYNVEMLKKYGFTYINMGRV